MVERKLFPDKTGFRAFSAGQQDQADRAVAAVPHQLQPFGLQLILRRQMAQLRQSLRFVNEEKIAAVSQCPGSAAE